MYLTYLYLHFGRKKIEPLADAKGSKFCYLRFVFTCTLELQRLM